jgi:hypothetical protein
MRTEKFLTNQEKNVSEPNQRSIAAVGQGFRIEAIGKMEGKVVSKVGLTFPVKSAVWIEDLSSWACIVGAGSVLEFGAENERNRSESHFFGASRPRLPMKVPRSGVAMISPKGVTRFAGDVVAIPWK